MDALTAVETHSAWLEIEIGLDSQAISLSHIERTRLFEHRIDQGLAALERASPGVVAKLEVFPGRPFAFTAQLNQEEIRALWPLYELRLLSDHSSPALTEVERDQNGDRPFIVIMFMYFQAEDSTEARGDRMILLVQAKDEAAAMKDAVEQCSGSMPVYFMGSDFIIYRRWWVAEHAYLNMMREEEYRTFGKAVMLSSSTARKKVAPIWKMEAVEEHVAYGSVRQRPESWKHMIV